MSHDKEQEEIVVEVDRAKWGFADEGGFLLSSTGKMCCLGFVCKQAGLSDEEIYKVGMPDSVVPTNPEGLLARLVSSQPSSLGYAASTHVAQAATSNDNASHRMGIREREKRCRDALLPLGIRLKFVGQLPRGRGDKARRVGKHHAVIL